MKILITLASAAVGALTLGAQSTTAVVAARVRDALTGKDLANAQLECVHLQTREVCAAVRESDGVFWLRSLAPGTYRLRATAGRDYQAREASRLEIPVAGLLQLDFDLRPITDLWEAGQYRAIFPSTGRSSVSLYGPDVDFSRAGSFLPPAKQESRLDASISTVVSPIEVESLPFSGRDLYSALVLQPEVATATGTARGLGVYTAGQRASSSNFLLDGVQANNYLVSGPQLVLAPEAAQEYRISVANYSAEYGGSSGLIANAVSRYGGEQGHGLAYVYLQNDALNANEITLRYNGLPRSPYKSAEPGLRVGGPVFKHRLFGFLALDYLRTRGRGACESHVVPGPDAIQEARQNRASQAVYLLSTFRPLANEGCTLPPGSTPPQLCPRCVAINVRPTQSVNRGSGLIRLDAPLPGHSRWIGRIAATRLDRPDYGFSPYPDLQASIQQFSTNAMTAIETASLHSTHEIRVAFGADALFFGPARRDLPGLVTSDADLPSNALGAAFENRGRAWEANYVLTATGGPHILKAGGDWLDRRLTGYLDARQGTYNFESLNAFLSDAPATLDPLNLSRLAATAGSLAVPAVQRRYAYDQGAFFIEDSYRAGNRLTLNGGVRFEHFGAPQNIGAAKDTLVNLGNGATEEDRVNTAKLADPSASPQQIYTGSAVWSLRTGLAWALDQNGRTVVRGGFGTFHDRLVDNLWLNVQENQYVRSSAASLGSVQRENYLAPIAALLNTTYVKKSPTGLQVLLTPQADSYFVIAFNKNLRPARVASAFGAIEHTLARNWKLETIGVWNHGGDLVVNDDVNRLENFVRPNRNLPMPVFLRSNDGYSRYAAWSLRGRWQGRNVTFQLAYTLSASFDNQSDALAGDFDLLRTQTQGQNAVPGYASFLRAYDSHLDYGHSDWDQRHNLVFYGVTHLPTLFPQSPFAPLLRGWTIATAGAIRSGTPFSIYADQPSQFAEPLRNNRANQICPGIIDQPLRQGRLLLDIDCFAPPSPGMPGNTRRNAFYGPGAWNLDFSLARQFRAPFFGESGQIVIRADAYNLFNHANLNNPESRYYCTAGSDSCLGDFGQALYGRRELGSYFPTLRPFTETGRQIQLMLRISF